MYNESPSYERWVENVNRGKRKLSYLISIRNREIVSKLSNYQRRSPGWNPEI